MRFSKVYSAQVNLLDAVVIDVEADISRGLHSFSVVGLPDKAVEESRDRVASAIKNSGFTSPKSTNQKIVISLAPADIKKEGPTFDLAIALAYLLAAEEITFNPEGKMFLGELALDGAVRGIRGVLPLAAHAKKQGFKELYVPSENAEEAALIDGITVMPVRTFSEVVSHINTKHKNGATQTNITPQNKTDVRYAAPDHTLDIADIRGQESAKRGLEIAAAGGHNICFYGPPGTGKTMLARALCGILPPLTFDEILEVTSIHSVAGTLRDHLITHPPIRSPHHTSSYVSMIGGGVFPKPGEVTLAHRGVLFLDEFPEFDRRVIESLRQPLEDGVVSISRARGSASFPARTIVVAAMNPCPCGNWGSDKVCTCSPSRLINYQRKISGPIVDRIDLWSEVGAVSHETLSHKEKTGPTSSEMRVAIIRARNLQKKRFEALEKITTNSEMGVRELEALVPLSQEVVSILNRSAEHLELSARAYHRTIKIARTIADLEGEEEVSENHILEALQYRPKNLNAS